MTSLHTVLLTGIFTMKATLWPNMKIHTNLYSYVSTRNALPLWRLLNSILWAFKHLVRNVAVGTFPLICVEQKQNLPLSSRTWSDAIFGLSTSSKSFGLVDIQIIIKSQYVDAIPCLYNIYRDVYTSCQVNKHILNTTYLSPQKKAFLTKAAQWNDKESKPG